MRTGYLRKERKREGVGDREKREEKEEREGREELQDREGKGKDKALP